MNIDLEELAAVIEQLDKTEFTDFRYEQGDLRLHVRRGGYISDSLPSAGASSGSSAAPVTVPQQATPSGPSPAAASPVAVVSNGHPVALTPADLPKGHVLVTAPMLGTYYSAPKPGETAFVQVGDTVTADAVLCIVEVMKLMNSVTAGVAGEVAAVFVKDGDLVEFEQPLFAIRTAS